MPLDLSNLAPRDAAAALRSYPRRFSASLLPIEGDDNWMRIISRAGPDGASALGIAKATTSRIGLLGDALRQVLVSDGLELPRAVVDPGETHDPLPSPEDLPTELHRVLEQLRVTANSIADEADRVPAGDWTRTATVTGTPDELSALDLLRVAVRTGADGLHLIDETIRAVRR